MTGVGTGWRSSGKDASQITAVQQAVGRHIVRVYALPTDVARVDTTSFNVTHAPTDGGQSGRALLPFGHSKDQRPDRLQCKQPLAPLDPGGVPLLSATTPVEEVTTYQVQWIVQRNEPALADALTLAGWRIYVTNSTPEDMSLVQATALYREAWTVEHGFHRWKGGYLPALPLFLPIAWRIRGRMLRLLIALQVRTLLEWQARRTLAAEQATVAGLVPGNPKMATAHPTAERLLSMFTHRHLILQHVGDQRVGQVLESLTPLQQRILHLLQLPATLYHFQVRLSVQTAVRSSPVAWADGL